MAVRFRQGFTRPVSYVHNNGTQVFVESYSVHIEGFASDKYAAEGKNGGLAAMGSNNIYHTYVPKTATKVIEAFKAAGLGYSLYDKDDGQASANEEARRVYQRLKSYLEPGTRCTVEVEVPYFNVFGVYRYDPAFEEPETETLNPLHNPALDAPHAPVPWE